MGVFLTYRHRSDLHVNLENLTFYLSLFRKFKVSDLRLITNLKTSKLGILTVEKLSTYPVDITSEYLC